MECRIETVLTLRELSQMTKLSEKKLRGMIKSGDLPVMRGCRDYRILLSDVTKLFQPVK